jgi:hypothetical protein
LEVVPADVEPIAPAAAQPPDVRSPNRPIKPPMLPWLIEMVVRIIAPGVVPYPTVILRVHVRRCRMPLLILVRPPLLSLLWLLRLSAPILPAPTLIATRLLTSPLLIVALLRLLLCLSLWLLLLLPLLLRRRIPHRLRSALRYMPLANSLLPRAALLLLSLLTFLLLLLLGVLLLLLLFLLLPASILRKDLLSKHRHSKRHHYRNKARKHSRKPFHTFLQSQIRTRLSWAINPAYAKNLAPHLT